MKNTQKGFTLVELLVVIAILAILAGVGVAGYTAFIGRAEDSNAQTEAHQIETIINTALIGKEAVKLEDKTGVVYVTKDGASRETTAAANKTEDVTADIGDMKANLELKADGLYYGSIKIAGVPAVEEEPADPAPETPVDPETPAEG